LKVITWNLGFWLYRSKHLEAWAYLREQIRPDIALLQEVRPPPPIKNEYYSFKQVRCGWGTTIYTRDLPASSELEIRGKYSNRLASVNIELPSKQKIIAVSIHAPIFKAAFFLF
jgi:hypothetical protein